MMYLDDYEAVEEVVTQWMNYPNDPICSGLNADVDQLFRRWCGVSVSFFFQMLDGRLLGHNALSRDSYGLLKIVIQEVDSSFKSRKDISLEAGFASSPFGRCLVAMHNDIVCAFQFADDEQAALRKFNKVWQVGNVSMCSEKIQVAVDQMFNFQVDSQFTILLTGTRFQNSVWKALLQIPFGTLISYNQLASMMGIPKSTRAVAGAIAQNSLGYLIPCHRVLRSDGGLGGFAWGISRKLCMIGWERSYDYLRQF